MGDSSGEVTPKTTAPPSDVSSMPGTPIVADLIPESAKAALRAGRDEGSFGKFDLMGHYAGELLGPVRFRRTLSCEKSTRR